MNGISGFLATMLAERPHGPAGEPLCECGAVVGPEEFTCSGCKARHERERREREARQQRDGLRLRCERGARTAPEWAVARIGTPDFERCVSYKPYRIAAERWKPAAGNLTLIGATGLGKTTAAIAILWRLADEAFQASLEKRSSEPANAAAGHLWAQSYALVRARREHPLGQGEAPLVEEAFRAPLLVVNDLGNEPNDTVVFELVNRRYYENRATIITTGLGPAAIRERYGDAFWRRLSERGAVVEATST